LERQEAEQVRREAEAHPGRRWEQLPTRVPATQPSARGLYQPARERARLHASLLEQEAGRDAASRDAGARDAAGRENMGRAAEGRASSPARELIV